MLYLTICLLSSDQLFSGLTLSCLHATQVLSTSKDSRQLLGRTSNLSHASFTVPSLKYLHDIFNHTAAVKMWVGPFLGLWARQGALWMGRTIFLTFSLFSSSDILARLSSTGLRNPSGIFSCTSGLTAPFMMDSRVALSVTFANALTLAQTSAKCSWARAACSNMSVINAVSSALLALSGSCLMNSGLVGISLGGSTTSTPPSCEVLPQVHCSGVLDCSEDDIYICIPHRFPLPHHYLFKISDGLA